MKRVASTLAQWKKFYEIAGAIKRLKPWEFMWEEDIITIRLPEISPLMSEQITIKNDMFIAGLKKQKKAKYEIDADLFYMPTPIKENKDDVPHYPLMCIAHL